MNETYPFSVPSGVHIVPVKSGINNLGSPSNPFATIYANDILDIEGGSLATDIAFVSGLADTNTNDIAFVSGLLDTNYVYAYASGIQEVAAADTFQDVTFDHNGEINGWTHTEGSAEFTCNKDGRYLVTYDAVLEKTGTGLAKPEFILDIDGSEVLGSQGSREIDSKNKEFRLSKTLVVNALASNVLKLRLASDNDTVRVLPVGGNATRQVSASLSMTKL